MKRIKFINDYNYNDVYADITLYVNAIDKKDINEIKKLSNQAIIENSSFSKNNKKDILYEMYDKKLLTIERLKFIVYRCTKYITISSLLMKRLIKEDNIQLLNILFKTFKFFDNEFIINILLIHYKNKQPISKSDLKKKLSIYRFGKKKHNSYYDSVIIYLNKACENGNETMVKSGNENIVKYLVEHEADINKETDNGQTPLFDACRKENENIVKYLVEHGADINKETNNGKTPLFYACRKENENIVKYLVEHEADINKETDNGETPLFYACESGNENIVKYLVEHGADINKEDGWDETS
ncbi:ankyrin [Neocallimastix lanati (nom. inval.)]|nr:ankyrin [Neocallimastix sp. JGI-2020a]